MVLSIIVSWPVNAFTSEKYFMHLGEFQIILYHLIAMLFMWGMRVLTKTLYEITFSRDMAIPALVYGVREGGIGLAKNIRSEKSMRFALRGFLTSDKTFEHRILMGKRVFITDDTLPKVIKDLNVKAVLVSPILKDEFRDNQQLQDILIERGVRIFMPTFNSTETDEEHLREVSIEDLLPRDEIEVDMNNIAGQLEGKRILVTGSAGSIGSEMVRLLAGFSPSEMVLIDQAETPQHDILLELENKWPEVKVDVVVTSITNKARMKHVFESFKPQFVFHAAAYKHVPMMEDNPAESVCNNVQGTRIIADLAVENGVEKFVMISTDKAVNPTNVMGCSKRICEIYVQSLDAAEKCGKVKGNTQFVTTRFGNVLGSNGSVIPLFREQIRKGGPVTVTHHDIIRFFMLIPEACKLVLEAGTHGEGGEIFVFDMGKPVRIADLAKRMIRLSGAKNVDIVYTGLRPGEKLYEEVLNDKEKTMPTSHEKIKIAKVRNYDYFEVQKQIDELVRLADSFDAMKIVAQMKAIVPEFVSRNSRYEVLDVAEGSH